MNDELVRNSLFPAYMRYMKEWRGTTRLGRMVFVLDIFAFIAFMEHDVFRNGHVDQEKLQSTSVLSPSVFLMAHICAWTDCAGQIHVSVYAVLSPFCRESGRISYGFAANTSRSIQRSLKKA